MWSFLQSSIYIKVNKEEPLTSSLVISLHRGQRREQIGLFNGNKHHSWIKSLTNQDSWMNPQYIKYGNDRCRLFFLAKIYMYRKLPDGLPSQVKVSMKLHIFSYGLPWQEMMERKKKREEEEREESRGLWVAMTGPLTGIVVRDCGLSCGQWATAVVEEYC